MAALELKCRQTTGLNGRLRAPVDVFCAPLAKRAT